MGIKKTYDIEALARDILKPPEDAKFDVDSQIDEGGSIYRARFVLEKGDELFEEYTIGIHRLTWEARRRFNRDYDFPGSTKDFWKKDYSGSTYFERDGHNRYSVKPSIMVWNTGVIRSGLLDAWYYLLMHPLKFLALVVLLVVGAAIGT